MLHAATHGYTFGFQLHPLTIQKFIHIAGRMAGGKDHGAAQLLPLLSNYTLAAAASIGASG